MSRVFFQEFVSLDGYVEGRNHELDWHVVDGDFNRYVASMLDAIDGILLGRLTYQLFAAYWPTATNPEACRMNELPKVVFSRTLKKVEWQNARLATAPAAEEVARLKREPGRDLAIFGSANLAASLVPHGLIDEYRFFVNPVVLGGGTPLLRDLAQRTKLQLTKSETLASGVVALYYRPA